MTAFVYILSNRSRVCVYTGVTDDLIRRVAEHKQHADPKSFSARYGTDRLVYFEQTEDIRSAIAREKQIKSWSRRKKNELIERKNPGWEDLYETLF